MKRFFLCLILLLAAGGPVALAQTADDQYLRIYALIQSADALESSGRPGNSLAGYQEAQTALQRFQKVYPDWNPKVINYRLNYVATKIAVASAKAPVGPTPKPATPAPAPPISSEAAAELQRQIASLQETVRQMVGDRSLMEAKLKEALAAQPAAVDPRELARAQEQLKELVKENELLKTTAAAVPSTPPASNNKALEEARKALAEANRKLDAQTELANSLSVEREALQARLNTVVTPPPAVDSGELIRAQERIKELLKENELLKTPVVDGKALDETRLALAEANRKLDTQTELAKNLAVEREALQARLNTAATLPAAVDSGELARAQERIKELLKEAELLKTPAVDGKALEETRLALAQANRRLETQAAQAKNLAAERSSLQERLDALTNSPAAIEALRAENDILKRQLADTRAAASKPDEADRKLAEAQTRIATLQSESEVLQLEKTALESRVKNLLAQQSKAPEVVAAPADRERIKRLEAERDEFAKKLTEANRELSSRRSRAATAHIEQLNRQMDGLRARVQVFEARAVPYTAEELALFQQPAPRLAASVAKPEKKSIRELPSGVTSLVASAQKHFAAQEFDQAEKDYLEILRRDESNAYTLANLAAIQLERGNLEEAEKNVTKAVAGTPDDDYALLILGQVKFRQEKYDESVEAFSRAAKLKPQSAELQNYLGVALGHKGLRDPAEQALRRAIVLNPGYGDAHYNLAVFYGTKDSSFLNLAKWHYQRAISAGHAKNPDLEKVFEGKSPSGETK